MEALDIPTDVKWMYIIQTWHNAMYIGVKWHTLHSIVDLVEATLLIANERGVKPAYIVLFHTPPL